MKSPFRLHYRAVVYCCCSLPHPHAVVCSRGLPTFDKTRKRYELLLLLNVAECCRGLATSDETRERYELQGLLPSGRASLGVEVERAQVAIGRACSPLEQFQVRMRKPYTCMDFATGEEPGACIFCSIFMTIGTSGMMQLML